jgi:hypothetical protein
MPIAGNIATAADLVRFAMRVDRKSATNAGYAKDRAVNKVPHWWHTGRPPAPWTA